MDIKVNELLILKYLSKNLEDDTQKEPNKIFIPTIQQSLGISALEFNYAKETLKKENFIRDNENDNTISIEPAGIRWLQDAPIRELDNKVKGVTLRNYKWFWLTIVIAAIGAISAIGSFILNYRAETQSSLLKEKDSLILLLQNKLSQKESSLILDSCEIDSLKRTKSYDSIPR